MCNWLRGGTTKSYFRMHQIYQVISHLERNEFEEFCVETGTETGGPLVWRLYTPKYLQPKNRSFGNHAELEGCLGNFPPLLR